MVPVTVQIPPGSLLDPSPTAAVVGGSVLTTQRIVDVVLKAFGVCAASQVLHVTLSQIRTYLFIYLFILFIYRFVQCTGERTIGHVVPYLVHPPNPTPLD